MKCECPNVVRYANALREVYAAHSSDLEVATLFAEALINRTPWRLWDLDTGGWQLFREVPLIVACHLALRPRGEVCLCVSSPSFE